MYPREQHGNLYYLVANLKKLVANLKKEKRFSAVSLENLLRMPEIIFISLPKKYKNNILNSLKLKRFYYVKDKVNTHPTNL